MQTSYDQEQTAQMDVKSRARQSFDASSDLTHSGLSHQLPGRGKHSFSTLTHQSPTEGNTRVGALAQMSASLHNLKFSPISLN